MTNKTYGNNFGGTVSYIYDKNKDIFAEIIFVFDNVDIIDYISSFIEDIPQSKFSMLMEYPNIINNIIIIEDNVSNWLNIIIEEVQ